MCVLQIPFFQRGEVVVLISNPDGSEAGGQWIWLRNITSRIHKMLKNSLGKIISLSHNIPIYKSSKVIYYSRKKRSRHVLHFPQVISLYRILTLLIRKLMQRLSDLRKVTEQAGAGLLAFKQRWNKRHLLRYPQSKKLWEIHEENRSTFPDPVLDQVFPISLMQSSTLADNFGLKEVCNFLPSGPGFRDPLWRSLWPTVMLLGEKNTHGPLRQNIVTYFP